MKSITQRTPVQIAEELEDLSDEDRIRVVLNIINNSGDWPFVFSLIASAMKAAEFEEEFNKKQVAEELKKAKIIGIYE